MRGPERLQRLGDPRQSRGGGRGRGPGCVRAPEPGRAVPPLFSLRTGGEIAARGGRLRSALCGSLPAASHRSPAPWGRSAVTARDGFRLSPSGFPRAAALSAARIPALRRPRTQTLASHPGRAVLRALCPHAGLRTLCGAALRGRPRGLLSRFSASSPVGRANTTWPSVPQRCRKRGDAAAPGWPRCGRRKTRSDGNWRGDGQEEQHGCAGGTAETEPAGPGLASRCPGQEEERSTAADGSGSGHAPLASRQQQLLPCAQQKDGF